MRAYLALAATVLLCSANSAFATRDVSSPTVSKGALRLESRFGFIPDTELLQQRYLADYGVNDLYATRLAVRFQKPDGESNDFTALEWENRFQLLEKATDGWDAAIRAHYNHTENEGIADQIGLDFLAQFTTGHFTHTANILFDVEVGDDRDGGLIAALAWKTQYPVHEDVDAGLEWFGDLGHINQQNGIAGQRHSIGPVVSYALNETYSFETGYQFGLTDPATDGLLKFFVRASF